MVSRWHVLLSVLSIKMAVACAPMQTKYMLTVDSLCVENANLKKSFILLPGIKDVSSEDLLFKEFSGYVTRAMTSKGYVQVSTPDNADIAVFLVYGIGDPTEHQYTYNIPVFGQTGISSSTTYGTLNTYGRHGTYSGTTTYNPSYGITGYTTHVGTYTTYFRYMSLNAYDMETFKRERKLLQVWKITVTSTGSSSDLRRVFPYLVGASKEYIGISTNGQIDGYMYENDPDVAEIKGIKTIEKKEK